MVTLFYSCGWIQGTMTDGHWLVGRGENHVAPTSMNSFFRDPASFRVCQFLILIIFFTIFKCIQSNLKILIYVFKSFLWDTLVPHKQLVFPTGSFLSFPHFINPPASLCLPIWIYLSALSIFLFLPFWLFSVTQRLKLFYSPKWFGLPECLSNF